MKALMTMKLFAITLLLGWSLMGCESKPSNANEKADSEQISESSANQDDGAKLSEIAPEEEDKDTMSAPVAEGSEEAASENNESEKLRGASIEETDSPKSKDGKGPIDTSQPTETCYLKASFISKGAGIDGDLHKQFKQLLEEWKLKEGAEEDFEMKYWGREGERDYCMSLSSLSATKKSAFKKAVQKLLGNTDMVFVTES